MRNCTIVVILFVSMCRMTISCTYAQLPEDIEKIIVSYYNELNDNGDADIRYACLVVEDSAHFVLGIHNHLFPVNEDEYMGVLEINRKMSVAWYCPVELRDKAPWNRLEHRDDCFDISALEDSLIPWYRYELFNGHWIQVRYDPVLEDEETIIFEEDGVKMTMMLPNALSFYSDGGSRYLTFYDAPQRFILYLSSSGDLFLGRWRRVDGQIVLMIDLICSENGIEAVSNEEKEWIPFPKTLEIRDDILYDSNTYTDFLQNQIDNGFMTREFKKATFAF